LETFEHSYILAIFNKTYIRFLEEF